MGSLRHMFTCILIIKTAAQMAVQTCNAQQEEIQSDPGIPYDSGAESDLVYNYGENPQLGILATRGFSKEGYIKDEPDLEQDDGNNFDDEDKHTFAVFKRGALEHRLRGKRRRMMKHNKLVHGGVSRQQVNLREDAEADSEAGNWTRKHAGSSQNSFKNGRSKLNSKSSSEYSSSNKLKENIRHSVEKSDGDKDVAGDTVNESPITGSGAEKPVIVLIKEEDLKRFTSERTVVDYSTEKENNEVDLKIENNEDDSDEIKKTVDEQKTKNKKSEKAKYKTKKLKESFKKYEDDNEKEYIVKPKETNINKLIKVKTKKEYDNDVDDYTKYANMSVINQGFLSSVERKYLGLQNKETPETNNILGLTLTKKPVFSIDLSKPRNIGDLGQINYKHNKKRPDKDTEEQIETSNENESKDSGIGNSKQEDNFELGNDNPITLSHYTFKPKIKTNIHSRTQTNNDTTYNHDGAKEDDEKYKRRSRKRAHSKENKDLTANGKHKSSGDNKFRSLHRSKASNVNEDRTENSQVLNQEMKTKLRNERDVKKNSHSLKGYHPNGMNGDRSSQSQLLNSDDCHQYDSDTQEGELNSSNEDKEDQEDRWRVYQSNGKRYSGKYSNQKGGTLEEYPDKDISKKLFARRAHVARYNDDDSLSTEECVGYKAEKVTTDTTEVTSTECPVTTGSAKQKTTSKAKTTSRTNNKSQSTKTVDPENDQISSDGKVDEYGQFLCGQLADNFVSAVMTKVRRSRKIMNELGFNNDTDESCDRCIEMKPSKLPDPDTLRSSLGRCVKSNGYKQTKCFKVPKPLESFLYLLLSYEQQNENSVYNKIQDESSFIFTGDYPESLSHNENSAVENKFNDGEESFSKDLFEKHLRDEGNEEKSENEIVNRENVRHSSPSGKESVLEEESTDAANEGNDSKDLESETKASLNKKQNKKLTSELDEQNPTQLDASLKGSDVSDMFDTKDFPPVGNKYSGYKAPEQYLYDSVGGNPVKQRRKVNKNDKFQSVQSGYNHPEEPNGKSFNNNPFSSSFANSKNVYSKYAHYRNNDNVKELNPNVMHGSMNQRYNNPFSPISKNNEPSNSVAGSSINKFVNYFGHPSKTLFRDSKFKVRGNYESQYPGPDNFLNSNWENNEYQLFPHEASMDGRDGLKSNYDNLRMIKRDAEPNYEDEPVFFEVPDMEYDLY